jgi:hypothetical protein
MVTKDWPVQIHHYAHGVVDSLLAEARSADTLFHSVEATWATDASIASLSGTEWLASALDEDGDSRVLMRVPSGALDIELRAGQAHVTAFAQTAKTAEAVLDEARGMLPLSAGISQDSVSVTFWSFEHASARASQVRREIAVAAWSDIDTNYTARTGTALAQLTHRPPEAAAGKLILWHGDPGTGKTWALRALIREWHGWADAHYIIDPEHFLGQSPGYMLQVITAGSRQRHDAWDDDDDPHDNDRWKLLVIEDAGELLGVDAKLQAGQALARLLNLCDGMVGQGLRLLVLITTNEEIGRLHPAVVRRGRCLANIEFGTLRDDEVAQWAVGHCVDPESVRGKHLLSDLYNMDRIESSSEHRLPGFGI